MRRACGHSVDSGILFGIVGHDGNRIRIHHEGSFIQNKNDFVRILGDIRMVKEMIECVLAQLECIWNCSLVRKIARVALDKFNRIRFGRHKREKK